MRARFPTLPCCLLGLTLLGPAPNPVRSDPAPAPPPAAPGKFHVFLLVGQSNMAGRAAIEPEDAAPRENVFLWNAPEKRWEPALPPYNRHSPHGKDAAMQKLNLGPSFARAWRESHPDIAVGIVCMARGGTAIAEWEKGRQKNWPLYDTAVAETREALKAGGELKAILWHQGESDAKRLDAYPDRLKALVENFRADLSAPSAPFVFGQAGRFNADYAGFNAMILEQPKAIPHTAVATTEGLKAIDSAHFDTIGQRELGRRYAAALENLLKRP
ncbi:MAG: sialate O-acetylesterase [Akkermansiaceae bacterium]|nr:sialate O-acetylesterase [Akkermansiaceae bacterium]MCP5550715.1 sialate O-acetylesterase [Akkermansiaceae bacterium]